MKNKCKNMMLGLMACATVLGATPATGVFAADPASFNNSTASTVSGANGETFTPGSDASQSQSHRVFLYMQQSQAAYSSRYHRYLSEMQQRVLTM